MKPMVSKILLGIIGVALLGMPAAAKEAVSPTPLTLSSAIDRAIKGNPRIKAAAFRVDASAAQVTRAQSGFYPQLTLSGTYNRTNNPMWAFGNKLNQGIIRQTDFNPVNLNDPDPIVNLATSVTVDWSLFDPAQTWIPWQQSKNNRDAAGSMLERTRQEVIARTAIGYAGVLLAEEQLTVVRTSLETARAHMKLVRTRFQSGFVVESDVLRAQVRIAELEQARLQVESELAIARASLNAVMGMPMDRRYDLVHSPDKGSKPEGDLKTWIQTALSHRPDLAQLGYREDISENEVKKSRSAHLPSIHLMGTYEINTEDFDDRGENYTLGAAMRLNLFSGMGISAGTKAAEASLASVRASQKAMETAIRVETRRAFYRTQSAWNRIQVAQGAVAQAEEALRIVRNRYENGLFTIVDLLDSQQALQQSRMNHFQASHDYKTATARLALAAGVIDADFK
ncbi:MAG: TolC family protein [Desulfobacterales bacterium]